MATRQPLEMDDETRAALQALAQEHDSAPGQRARALLAYADGKPTRMVAHDTGLNPWQTRYWRRRFQAQGLAALAGAEPTQPQPTAADPTEDGEDAPNGAPIVAVSAPPQKKVRKADPARKAAKAAKATAADTPEAPDLTVRPADTLAEAGRKVLYRYFREMLAHEDGTREGKDIEELHDMRVATRRQRAAFEVFAGAYAEKTVRKHLRGLRATGRALGAVRDLDVFMEKAQHYLDAHPEGDAHGLDPLLAVWAGQRTAARAEMLIYLDSARYAEFKTEFARFLNTPGAGLPKDHSDRFAPRVAHVLPALVYERLAQVWAYDGAIATANYIELHALRIEFKKLRYTLEYFRDVLDDPAKAVIREVKAVQDHLGDLNDADVACGILAGVLATWEQQQMGLPMEARQSSEPLVAYLAAKHAERHQLLVTFPAVWAKFNRPEIREWLGAAMGHL